VERLNLADIWKGIPRQPRFISAAPYLLLAAVVLFLLEVIERRTGLFSSFWFRLKLSRFLPRLMSLGVSQPVRSQPAAAGGSTAGKVTVGPASLSTGKLAEPLARTSAKSEPSAPEPKKEAKKQAADTSMLDALAHAQERARKRTERK
jgi:hypothetical protein